MPDPSRYRTTHQSRNHNDFATERYRRQYQRKLRRSLAPESPESSDLRKTGRWIQVNVFNIGSRRGTNRGREPIILRIGSVERISPRIPKLSSPDLSNFRRFHFQLPDPGVPVCKTLIEGKSAVGR